ncbi:MAG: CbtA family protein [Acidimicrobiia bacterium]
MLKGFDGTRLRSILGVALVLGAASGILASILSTVIAEPIIDDAIALEESRADPNAPPEPELVARELQRGTGRFAAYALGGAAFGLLFGLTYALLRRSHTEPLRCAALTGAVLTGAITISPWLKYPPNPPAAGDPATLAERQQLYSLLILVSAVVLLGAIALAGRLRAAHWAEHRRVAAVVIAGAIAMAAVFALFPPAPDAACAPADLVWRFRVASLATNMVVWTGLALGFGVIAAGSHRKVAASVSPGRR